MIPTTGTRVRTEADPLLTGVCELSLTRAVLTYQDQGDRKVPGGRMGDLGLGVVLDGARPSRSEVLDLGSARLRTVSLNGPLVILGWVYASTVRALRDGLATNPDELRRLTLPLGLRALERNGFNALTRPLVLRLGFSDLVRDLDLHEGTAVRLLLPAGGVVRIHLEYDTTTLVARTGMASRNPALEGALRDAFSDSNLLGARGSGAAATQSYYLPFSPPSCVSEARRLLRRMRQGFLHLLARFEPDRYRVVREQLDTFGERDSLRALGELGTDRQLRRLDGGGTGRGRRVH